MKACNKFEELFILDDEKQLLEHIMSCEDCRKEYEQMKAVSGLIQEAKPFIKRRQRELRKMSAVMVAGMFIIGLTSFAFVNYMPEYKYETAISSEMYPVDEYGLVELY